MFTNLLVLQVIVPVFEYRESVAKLQADHFSKLLFYLKFFVFQL